MAPPTNRPDYDQTLKHLLTDAHDGMLALLLPGARWLGERQSELPAILRQADLVWEVVSDSGERLLLHVELQTNPDPLIGERVAEYGLRLWRQDRLPVYSVVIYLRQRGGLPTSPFVLERGGGQEGLRYRYDVVRLWEEPAERVLGLAEPGLWPLAALMKGEPLATLETVAERLAHAPLQPGARGELTGILAVLAGLRLPRPVVEQVLRRNPMFRELMNESSVVELLREEIQKEAEAKGFAEGEAQGEARGEAKGFAEGEARGEARGEAKGFAEGEARGEVKGQRELLRTILESRFGPLDAEETVALGTAPEAVLRALATYLVTDSREQARARLGLA